MRQIICIECSQSVPEQLIDGHLASGCELANPSQQGKKRKHAPLAPIFQSSRHDSSSPPPPLGEPDLDARPTPKRPKTAKERLADAAPLAERMRPRTLDDLVGQEHLVGKNSVLRGLIESGSTGCIIFWGPPGSGKTTIARVIASHTSSTFIELSATSSGTSEVKSIIDAAKSRLGLSGRKTILFIDEIQRFNKAQQDAFLPALEAGWIELVGATTENPSFRMTGALLSRCRVFTLEPLSDEQIKQILLSACNRCNSGEPPIQILDLIASLAAGDARTALGLLELVLTTPPTMSEEVLVRNLKKSVSARYDRSGEDRYDMISAMHKSLRGSDGSAAMYWLARMLTAGEDPLYIARRLIVVASEDVGLADNSALPLAVATYSACQTIGMPECRINLAHCVAYLAEAPKSTRSYEAYKKAEEAAAQDAAVPVPMVIRNAPTKLMKELGYGEGYAYNPAYAHPVHNEYLPLERQGQVYLRKAGDQSEKAWDEQLLMRWEIRANGGKDWDGRTKDNTIPKDVGS